MVSPLGWESIARFLVWWSRLGRFEARLRCFPVKSLVAVSARTGDLKPLAAVAPAVLAWVDGSVPVAEVAQPTGPGTTRCLGFF